MARSVEEMAEEAILLQATLNAIGLWNMANQTLEALTEVEVKRIKTEQRLREVRREIEAVIDGKKGGN